MRPNRLDTAAAALALGLIAAAAPAARAADRYDVDVTVVVTPKAVKALAAKKRGILIFGDYFGRPKPEARKRAVEGEITLSPKFEVALPAGGGTAHVVPAKIHADRLGWVEGPVLVSLTVVSTITSSDLNMLDCGFVNASVAELQKAPPTVRCKLIGEDG